MSAPITMHSFTDCQAQARALAGRIADKLRGALAERGHATLAVSGGTTPRALFGHLAHEQLDWRAVQVTLVDERWVAEADPRSNAALVRSTLLVDQAAAATLVPLYTGDATPEAGLAQASARIAALPRPFDALVLGMGDDGHTASFFPDGDQLGAALDLDTTALVLPMRAKDAGEPRITLTLPVVLDTRALYLLIAGEHKLAVLRAAERGGDVPMRAVLSQQRVPLSVYWCP